MKEQWTRCLGKMTYGIYVLTSCHQDEFNGMIASLVSLVSYEPPLIMAAVHVDRYTNKLIKRSGSFAVHIISERQRDYMIRFKGSDPIAKFNNIEWSKGKSGSPILKDCIAYMDCVVKEIYTPGNHVIYIGEVMDAKMNNDEKPFTTLDYGRVYTGKN